MKSKATKWMGQLVILGILGGLLSGCAWSIGSDKGGGKIVSQTTRGQELIDLKRAKDQGALTEDEYQSQRKLVMERP